MTESSDRHAPDKLVRRFLARNTGCGFASSLASKEDGMLWQVVHGIPRETNARDANRFLLDAAKQSKVGVLVYPALRSAGDIATLLVLLAQDPRWELKESPRRDFDRDDVLAWAKWKSADGQQTSVMGLAPLGSMPVHRRAPYVSLVVWPGGRENRHHEPKGSTLGFLDVKLPPELDDPETYASLFAMTERDVKEINAHVGEKAARHYVTFCLPREVRSLLFPA